MHLKGPGTSSGFTLPQIFFLTLVSQILCMTSVHAALIVIRTPRINEEEAAENLLQITPVYESKRRGIQRCDAFSSSSCDLRFPVPGTAWAPRAPECQQRANTKRDFATLAKRLFIEDSL